MRRILALALSLSFVLPASAQETPKNKRQLRRALDGIVADPMLSNAIVGVNVVDARSGEVLYKHNEKKTLMPASNGKLYTTAVVLDQLGPDFTYETRLYAQSGDIEEGVLRSNLLVRGSGDPAIGGRFNDGDITEVFRNWARALRERGISAIEGDIIGDDDLFDDLQLGYGWSWDDEPWYYSAEISALSLNDNAVDFTLDPSRPGGAGRLSWSPIGTSYVDVRNSSITVDSTESLDEGYTRTRDDNIMVVSTRVPVGYTERESIAVHNPTAFFVHVLREVLVGEGISVSGRPVDVDDLSIRPSYDQALLLAGHTSPRLDSIAVEINKPSNNLYAELVLKTLGALRPDTTSDATPGSAAMGWAAGMRTLAAARVDTSLIRLVDGSGLSRMNLVSPEMTTDLLAYMYSHPDTTISRAFLESLPIAGVDGTLEFRMRDTPAASNVRAKTGTLTGASTLSGFVTTAGGSPLIFSVMVNNHTHPSRVARRLQDAIAETLARFTR